MPMKFGVDFRDAKIGPIKKIRPNFEKICSIQYWANPGESKSKNVPLDPFVHFVFAENRFPAPCALKTGGKPRRPKRTLMPVVGRKNTDFGQKCFKRQTVIASVICRMPEFF